MKLASLFLALGLLFGSASAQRVPFGTPWTLFRFGESGEEATVPAFTAPTLQFDAGRITGSTGCNTYSAGYLARGHDLRIGALSSGRALCSSPAASVREQYLLRSLAQVKRFEVSGDFLVLFTSDRQTLVFRRSE